MLSYKQLTTEAVEQLRLRLEEHVRSANMPLRAVVSVRCYRRQVYLLGRYQKFARDVPQSEWTLSSGEDAGERKGRGSVEEIISGAARVVLGAKACHMHACGREDIDVRMLGNGRPFVLEVVEPIVAVTTERISALQSYIHNRQGLNGAGDIDVTSLGLTHKGTWSSMQTVAEEKRKAYRCVVLCSRPVDAAARAQIEALSSRDMDDNGTPCLELHQLTPLRVLHRRSLLERKRFIYNIKVTPVNGQFFLLDLVTSAGTYVKEFVHGDLGRTEPSIAAVLDCQSDILQLDVIKLFDDFPGGAMES